MCSKISNLTQAVWWSGKVCLSMIAPISPVSGLKYWWLNDIEMRSSDFLRSLKMLFHEASKSFVISGISVLIYSFNQSLLMGNYLMLEQFWHLKWREFSLTANQILRKLTMRMSFLENQWNIWKTQKWVLISQENWDVAWKFCRLKVYV